MRVKGVGENEIASIQTGASVRFVDHVHVALVLNEQLDGNLRNHNQKQNNQPRRKRDA